MNGLTKSNCCLQSSNLKTKIFIISHKIVVSCSVLLTKYFSGYQIKQNEMGRACSVCGGEERCKQRSGGET